MEEEFEILSFDSEEFYADDEAEWFYQTPLTMFQKKIWLHCVIRAELNAYLPSLTSPLGSNLNYLEGSLGSTKRYLGTSLKEINLMKRHETLCFFQWWKPHGIPSNLLGTWDLLDTQCNSCLTLSTWLMRLAFLKKTWSTFRTTQRSGCSIQRNFEPHLWSSNHDLIHSTLKWGRGLSIIRNFIRKFWIWIPKFEKET